MSRPRYTAMARQRSAAGTVGTSSASTRQAVPEVVCVSDCSVELSDDERRRRLEERAEGEDDLALVCRAILEVEGDA